MVQLPDHDYFVGMLGEVMAARSSEPVIITGADLDEKQGPTIQFASAAVQLTSGYRPEELVGKRLGILFPAELIPEVIEVLRSAADSREAIIVDQEARHRSGKVKWIEICTSPVFDRDGNLIHFVRTGRDITARKTAEQSRETTQRLLASVFGVINEPLAVADNDGKLIMANTAVTRRLGWSVIDMMGKPATMLLAGVDQPQLTELIVSGAAVDQTRQFKGSLLCKGMPNAHGEVELTSLRLCFGMQ